jgi:hypothetical protein
VSRFVRTLLLAAAVTFSLATSAANATPTGGLGGTLGEMWTTVLQTPAPQNPFATEGASTCFALEDNVVAPFGPTGADSCTVSRRTQIFVAGYTFECSSFPNDHVGYGTTEAELRKCAHAAVADITRVTVTVDRRPVPVTNVETRLLSIYLPRNNIFGVTGADRNGSSVAVGWVVLLDPLAPGKHTIKIRTERGTATSTITTTIIVRERSA